MHPCRYSGVCQRRRNDGGSILRNRPTNTRRTAIIMPAASESTAACSVDRATFRNRQPRSYLKHQVLWSVVLPAAHWVSRWKIACIRCPAGVPTPCPCYGRQSTLPQALSRSGWVPRSSPIAPVVWLPWKKSSQGAGELLPQGLPTLSWIESCQLKL